MNMSPNNLLRSPKSKNLLFFLLLPAWLMACQGINQTEPIGTSDGRYRATAQPDRIMQSIAEKPSNQLVFSWRTSSMVLEGYLELLPQWQEAHSGITPLIYTAIKVPVHFQGSTDHYFQVSIDSLQPHTHYMIRVGCQNHRSEWMAVQTHSDRSDQPLTILSFGDVQNDILEFAPRVFRKAFSSFANASLLMHAGDLTLSSGSDQTWGEWFESGGWHFRQIPSLPSAGNSDHFRLQKDPVDVRLLYPQWHGVFNLPKNGPEGLNNLAYYDDFPNVRIISLYTNFESMEEGKEIRIAPEAEIDMALFEKQLEWLEEVLSSRNQQWCIVQMHHPVLTARQERGNPLVHDHIRPLLEKYAVDLVLQGHDHVYARGQYPSEEKAILPVYIISVAGGKLQDLDPYLSWANVSYENHQFFHAIHIHEGKLVFEAYNYTGIRKDHLQITLNSDGTKNISDVGSIQ